jgi:putative ATP-dependent endonuclease of OLD family
MNNVGKSTVLEALDFMLGPDRIGWPDAINEHDFTGSAYIGENDIPTNIRIECTLTELNERQKRLFHPYLDYWDSSQECYAPMEDLPEPLDESRYALNCLRLEFESFYDREEDEFNANTFFSKSPTDENGTKKALSKTNKREIGYLYLRPVRTGSRALSLERGSLLDIISQLKEIRTSSWETVLGNLSGLGNQLDNTEFRDILGAIETKVRQFTPLVSEGKKSMQFEVTNLTRRHLRQTMTLFAGSEPSDALVPYKQLGTGTINVMLFALMTQIAELKRTKDRNVIFAMEEPEIALPPHTQRRIIDELFTVSNQTLVTSHSPYVTERFIGKRIVVLKHSPEGLNGYCVDTDLRNL